MATNPDGQTTPYTEAPAEETTTTTVVEETTTTTEAPAEETTTTTEAFDVDKAAEEQREATAAAIQSGKEGSEVAEPANDPVLGENTRPIAEVQAEARNEAIANHEAEQGRQG